MRILIWMVYASISVLLYQNCAPMEAFDYGSSSPSSFSGGTATFSSVQSIFANKCLACHSSPTATNKSVGLASYNDVVMSGSVTAGNANLSTLYTEVESGQMPPNNPLPQFEINQIKLWIDSGAKNDMTSNSGNGNNNTGGNTNAAPSANAGRDLNLQLPATGIGIQGMASDSDGSVSSTTWTQVSGPSTATLMGANTLTLFASNLVAGVYIFELLVEDNQGATSTDQVYLNVSAAQVTTVSFAQLKNNIFNSRCQNCHSGSNPSANFSVDTYQNILTRVNPGSPSLSTLFQKIQDDSMPKNGSPLSQADKNSISTWISEGALNN